MPFLRTLKRAFGFGGDELDEEELEKSLMEKVYLYEKNFLQDCEIIDRKITKNKSADSLILSVKYTLKGDICTQKEILVK